VKYRLRFRKEIPDDIAEACRWYEGRQGVRLRNRFVRELKSTFARIASMAEAYAKGERDVRTARLYRFPYVVYFRFMGMMVEIVAVMYGGRDSSVWQRRI
jgi:plasmid stabilization system protein ParE